MTTRFFFALAALLVADVARGQVVPDSGRVYCATRELLLQRSMKFVALGDSLLSLDPAPGSKTLVQTRAGVRDIVWTDGLQDCARLTESTQRQVRQRREDAAREAANAVAEQRREAAERAEALRVLPLPVAILGPAIDVDMFGGVEVAVGLRNQSRKVIRYAYFTFVPYNAVGDVQRSQFGGASTVRAEFTGPLDPGGDETVKWRALWHNSTISCVRLTRLEVRYMDGTSRVFSPPSTYTYSPTGNRCTYEAQQNPRF